MRMIQRMKNMQVGINAEIVYKHIAFILGWGLEVEMLDGTCFQTVGNVKEHHIRLINKLGLATGSYAAIAEVQLE